MGVVYKVSSLIDDSRFYIGSSIKDGSVRKSRHYSDLKYNKHPNQKMQNYFNKYGLENFTFEIIENDIDLGKEIEREQFYIDTLKPTFNIRLLANNNLGLRYKKKIPDSKESIEKRVKTWKDSFTEERRMKLSLARKGKPQSQEFIDNAKKRMMGNTHSKGSIRTDEFKENCRKKLTGRKKSEESKLKRKLNYKKHIFTEETRIKMSESAKGKKLSEESIKKRTETRRLNGWNKRNNIMLDNNV